MGRFSRHSSLVTEPALSRSTPLMVRLSLTTLSAAEWATPVPSGFDKLTTPSRAESKGLSRGLPKGHCFFWALAAVLALGASIQPAFAQFSQQGPKLVGTGTMGTADQGWSVSVSTDGNTAIVGGYGDNSSAGAAWVFVFTAPVKKRRGKLTSE